MNLPVFCLRVTLTRQKTLCNFVQFAFVNSITFTFERYLTVATNCAARHPLCGQV